MNDLDTRPHALYRFYNASGELLYIGISADLPERIKQHRDSKTWWTEVARIAMEHFSTRGQVMAAERRAIIAEQPRWNIQHNGVTAQQVKRESRLVWHCWQCERPVGDGDGYIHVDWGAAMKLRDVRRRRQIGIEQDSCPECGKPATYIRSADRFSHDDGSENARCWVALIRRPLSEQAPFQRIRLVKASELLGDAEPRWQVHHAKCDPYPERDDYWYGVERIRSLDRLIDMWAHVIEKNWVAEATDISDFMRRAAADVRTRWSA